MRQMEAFADSLVHEDIVGERMLSAAEWIALAPNVQYFNRLMQGYYEYARRKVEKRT